MILFSFCNTPYFLKPDLQRGEKENEELFVKYYWLSQLVVKSQEEKKRKLLIWRRFKM